MRPSASRAHSPLFLPWSTRVHTCQSTRSSGREFDAKSSLSFHPSGRSKSLNRLGLPHAWPFPRPSRPGREAARGECLR
jgi:hypothetical protein